MFIDLTVDDQPSKKVKKTPDWVPGLKLTTYHKQIILDPVGWMTDTIIDAAQTLLKQQFPHIQSLQSVTLGLTMSFHVQTGELLQIIHCNNHWLTVSSIGDQASQPSVKVYDSMYHSVPSLGKAQIACLLSTSEDFIRVKIMDVQKQVCIASYFVMLHIISPYIGG